MYRGRKWSKKSQRVEEKRGKTEKGERGLEKCKVKINLYSVYQIKKGNSFANSSWLYCFIQKSFKLHKLACFSHVDVSNQPMH